MKKNSQQGNSKTTIAKLQKELASKNRLLKIEAALEKVRKSALAMKDPADMVDVCRIISDQLQMLSTGNIRNVQTAIINEAKGIYLNYEYFTQYKTTSTLEIEIKLHPVVVEFVKKIKKSSDAFFTKTFEGEALKDWREYRRKTNQNDDPILDKAKSLHYYFYSIGPGALGISTYSPLNKEDIAVFKRFRNVFELAYRRFVDIEQAIAQAREAQIEASLERVRAVAMGMNKPEDLLNIGKVLFDELRKLGFNHIRNVLISIFNDDGGIIMDYDYSDFLGGSITKIFYNSHPVIENFMNKMRKANDAFAEIVIDSNQMIGLEELRKKIGKQPDPRLKNVTVLYYYNYSIGSGSIGISNFNPIAEEQRGILKRFGNVFDLAYRRYNDIAFAEAQAHEAKIEAALERVRAVAMSMTKPDDLLNICEILFNELHTLDFKEFRNTMINIHNDEKGFLLNYDYSDVIGKSIIQYYYNVHPVVEYEMKQLRSAKDAFSEIAITGKELDDWKELRKRQGEKDDPRLNNVAALYYYFYSVGSASIGISTTRSISQENHEILRRFRNVFDLAYRRYNDIALAEAQAREAQIEAALERVRAKAMAMHTSNDLSETMGVVFTELPKLGINSLRCGVVLLSKTSSKGVFYAAASTPESDSFTMIGSGEMSAHPIFEKQYECWLKNENYFTTLSDEELKSYYESLFSRLPTPYTPREHRGEKEHGYYFPFSEGMFYAWAEEPYSENQINILNRFKAILDLTFRRYLDLQKAEAQAREAKIEMCLERVRARTMAMQKSEELSEASFVLFKQLEELGEVAEQISIGIFNEEEGVFELYATIYGSQWKETGRFPLTKHPVHKKTYESWKEQKKSLIIDLTGEELEDFNRFKMENSTQYKSEEELPKNRWVIHSAYFSKGALLFSTHEPRPVETIQLLERFAGVFDLTYTRFLDLKNAEAQAREAQIELALERVRARTMAMQRSEELSEAAYVLFQQFKDLGQKPEQFTIGIIKEAEHIIEFWHTWLGSPMEAKVIMTIDEPHVANRAYTLWKEQNKSAIIDLSGKELKEYNVYRKKRLQEANVDLGTVLDEEQRRIIYLAFFSKGTISISTHEPRPAETIQLLERFAGVFDLTYTRFLDLKNAEAQARESQIELALERVRARTMAMRQSDELSETAAVLFQEFKKLGEEELLQITLGFYDEAQGLMEFRVTSWAGGGEQINRAFNLSIEEPTLLKPVFTAWKEQKKSIVVDLKAEKLESWLKYRNANVGVTVRSEDTGGRRVVSVAFFSKGHISISSPEPRSPETIQMLERFAGVFDLTYTRFLDLKNAEAQAREAKIEASLERVRSKTMAMQQSSDLHEVIKVVTDQLLELGIKFNVANFAKVHSEGSWDMWISTPEQSYPALIYVPYFDHRLFNNLIEIISKGVDFLADVYEYEEKNIFFKHFFENTLGKNTPEERKRYVMNCKGLARSIFLTKNIWLAVSNYDGVPFSDEENAIFKRFAKVFEQTYTRFLDLQKAEAQAKEAKIEASLEKVRARAMSMHTPDDLSETVSLFFKELKSLNVLPWRCGVGRIDEETRTTYLTTTSITKDGEITEVTGKLKQTGHPILDGIFENWKLQKEYFPVLRGDEINKYYSIIKPQIAYPDYPLDAVQYGHNIPFKEGFIFAWTENRLSEEELQIFRRFTSVLSLTYRRYLDLKEAEGRAFEAVRQASLDRVRAEIASMRTAEDLNRITPVIWRELKTLDVPFFRCGVYIVNEIDENVSVYLTTPDGKSLGVLHLTFESNVLTSNTVKRWRENQIYKEHWNKEEFIKWTKLMLEQGQIQKVEIYQGSVEPPESLHLHFVPFAQGMLYVGDVNPLTDENLELVRTLAEAFSIAYARYEDFKNIEEAKNRTEITLNELKSAQALLIHSEKMASLGELTAGIAHEIKNPLNFVNNFSEVSRELLDEMKSGLQNKNTEEVLDIIEDLKQNLEKINHHGKRADSIVKGMLLHSRGTSGEKVLTNINDLLDQYVNLAYHGLRAQNKEFNITIEKNYDEFLEKINVVPQDISRVFLNLVNNACYAAFEKKKMNGNNFSPTLKVSTKNLHNKVEIRIRDNGNGIPESIKEQIFNPFFTTKPTGEGTGLGLSLSYDIVIKQHSGEIIFESEEGKYTEFVVRLPVS